MDLEMQNHLEILSDKIRLDTLKTLHRMGYGHLGGSFSIAELLAVLYGKQMKIKPSDSSWNERDYLVLSKGHAGPGLYATLANVGYFEKEMLKTLNEGGTNLPSHPDRLKTPGVDATTGSLGQGTSVAAGLATGLRMDDKDNMVYLICGDGELNEGQCWEAFQYIAHFRLNNCLVIIDDNKKQLDGLTVDIMNPFDFKKKMEAFGFRTLRVKGNDIVAIDEAITELKSTKDQAICLILDSTKGQGISYFEELKDNHSVKFNHDEINQATSTAIAKLEKAIEERENLYV